MKKNRITFAVMFYVLIFLSGAIAFLLFLPNNQIVPAFEEGKLNLVVEGRVDNSAVQPKIMDDEVLLPLDTVKKYLDPNIWWDENLKKVTVTTKDKVIRMKTDSLNALVNNKPITLKIPVTCENNTVYIPIEFLRDFYNIEINYLKSENVIIIDYKNSPKHIVEVTGKDAVIRKGQSIHYPIIKKYDLNANNPEEKELRVFGEYGKWYEVRAWDGSVGYIEKKFVIEKETPAQQAPAEEQKTDQWKPGKGKVNLVWEMMYTQRPDLSKVNKMEGLDVVSPTWFQVANQDGTLINRSDSKYVSWAHSNGYKVWALLANDSGSPAMTHKFLNNTDSRDNLIRQILAFASIYKLDGINIDFENINKEDKDALTQFVREITPLLKQQGLIVSVDITVPDGSSNWSLCYDRKALGQIADYIMLMTYDQHWASGSSAGSIAQITWVEDNLKKVLTMVPKEKLLLGLPFYTRLWKEETDKNGKIKLSSQVLTMDAARKTVKDNNASTRWDEQSGQFYSEFKKDNATYKIWIEDENSINLKSSLAQKYNLAGTCAWRRGDETQRVWNVLNKNLKVINNYSAWLAENKDKKYVYAN